MRKLLFLSFSMFLMLIGCSGGSSIVSPENGLQSNNSQISTDINIPVGVSDRFNDGSPYEGQGILGLFQLAINESNSSAELVPLRTNSLEDVLEVVDITNFLQLAPCTSCVKIKSVALDSFDHVVVSIGIKHPFGVGDPLKPITGRNRADLHVFNVEGIVFSDSIGINFPGILESKSGFELLNASGYTDYLDETIDSFYPTDATIHPYILHFDDYTIGNFDPANPMGFQSVTDPPPSGNLVMAMGCDYSYKDYVFSLPSESVNLLFGVGCTYAVSSASKSQRFNPEYRIPQHNKKAASEVHVEIFDNQLKGGQSSSTAELYVKVLDVNHGAPVGTALNEMRTDSSVSQIKIEVPNVTSSPVIISSPTPISGDGRDPLNPLTYSVVIANTGNAPEGAYKGLVKVLDSYLPGQNTSPLLNGMDGIKRVSPVENPLTGLFAIQEFATYAVFSIDVAAGTLPPTACFTTNPVGDPNLSIATCTTVQFDASCSTDDSAIVSYEWDFNWDGVPANFNDDTSGANQYFLTRFFGVEGVFNVALRVTDDESPGLTDIESIVINVVGTGGAEISGTETTVINLDRRYYVDMIETYENWVYVLNKGTVNGDQGLWIYASCALGDGWLAPVQVSTSSLDDNPRACGLDVTANGRPVVAWIDSLNHACISKATDETAYTWSPRQDMFSTAVPNCPNVDIACHPSNPDFATIAIIDYDRPSSGYPHRIQNRYTTDLLSATPTWTYAGYETAGGFWTIWYVQDVNIEITTDGEMDEIVWRYISGSNMNYVFHRRWTPGGTYGTWSPCCGYVAPTSSGSLVKSSPDLIVDNQNRPVVVYTEAGGSTPVPPFKLFLNRGTDTSNPSWGAPIQITSYATGFVDKPSIAQEPSTNELWIVYNHYSTTPLEMSQILRARFNDALSPIDVDVLWNTDDASNTHEDKFPHIVYASDSGVDRMVTIWYDNSPYVRINHKKTDL